MVSLRQQISVAREGTVKTSGEEFTIDSLGDMVNVELEYSLADGEKHGQHGHARIRLTDVPVVLGGYFPVRTTSYNPFSKPASSQFRFETSEFQSRYGFIIQQPLEVWAHSTTIVVAESKMLVKGPERHPDKLAAMPTAILGAPLILEPDKPKQSFQLLVDPFGGQVVRDRTRLTFRYADAREIGELLIVPFVKNQPGSGQILDDGTGAIFTVQGLKPQRNYAITLQVDGDITHDWDCTTKTGPYFDGFRR